MKFGKSINLRYMIQKMRQTTKDSHHFSEVQALQAVQQENQISCSMYLFE